MVIEWAGLRLMWLSGRHKKDHAGVEVFKGAIMIVLAMEVANNVDSKCHTNVTVGTENHSPRVTPLPGDLHGALCLS